MIARLLFILYKQEDHVIPKYYYTILRLIFCFSYFIAICILSFATEKDFKLNILDHTGLEEDILLKNLEYTFISKLSQQRIVYNASSNLEFRTYHDIASSKSVSTMISCTLEQVQETENFKVLKLNTKYNLYDIYYMGENHIDDATKKVYEIDKIEVYDAKVKTTVFKRKAVKTVKMIDVYWKGKDR